MIFREFAKLTGFVFVLALAVFHGTNVAAIDPDTGDAEELLPDDRRGRVRTLRLRDLLEIEYGWHGTINKALLIFDDGASTQGYLPVDNWGFPSRITIDGQTEKFNGWRFGSRLELGWDPFSTREVNQINRSIDWDADLRKAEVGLFSDEYGRFFFGQGSMASDGSAEVDLSGTTLVGQSRVERIAGGQLYRLKDGELSNIAVSETFTNMDGFGRRLRVRYGTPQINGFRISAALGRTYLPDKTDDLGWDVALRYAETLGPFQVASAVSYAANFSGEEKTISGSASLLHVPSGISATFAAGWNDTRGEPQEEYIYSKLGYQVEWFEIGTTAFSIDTYQGRAIKVANDTSTSHGFQFTQRVEDWLTTFYLGVRRYQYDAPDESYQDGLAVITGAAFKF